MTKCEVCGREGAKYRFIYDVIHEDIIESYLCDKCYQDKDTLEHLKEEKRRERRLRKEREEDWERRDRDMRLWATHLQNQK